MGSSVVMAVFGVAMVSMAWFRRRHDAKFRVALIAFSGLLVLAMAPISFVEALREEPPRGCEVVRPAG